MRIAITGATGKVGGAVATLLTEQPAGTGPDLRLVVRSPRRAPEVPGAEVVRAEFSDAAACRKAFTGVDALLLVSAGESADRVQQHRTAIAAAAEAGVGHIVYTSFLGASTDAEFTLARDHGTTEQALRDSGLPWTFLRDSFYADVLLDFAGEERVIRGPGGAGRCAFVARADVAEVAAAILRDPATWAGRTLDLTGPSAVTLAEAAMILTAARGEEYRYVDETLEEARASRAPYGAPDWMVEAWISTYTAIASGALDVVSTDVEAVLGRAPRPLAEVVASPL
ncbi:SDR family oxidoreductase [Brachybacterium sp. FME24]|uniref:SDR family oxidoreductase n=1 Tax=Brachybacterium sp. FME24 TaxID=2742605 RepID=UPI0018682802|nr:SDR family oxidoreductase [Brachybacterium sp. FME24]